jgi:hypothetical protein
MFNAYNEYERIPAFPEGTKLSELLTITGNHDTNPRKQDGTKLFKAGGKIVQGWLSFSHRGEYLPSKDILPSPLVLNWIDNHMLSITYDQIYFEAIPFDDGRVSLYAKYNQIIGSHLLGWFTAEEFGL